MMAAAQPFLSGAISKTVNMPKDTAPEDIAAAYTEGWRLGLKALAIYRDGSKEVQPLSTKAKADKAQQMLPGPRRERLPDTRQSITHKFSISGHEGYITVGLYPDGRPGELFITMAKEGSTIGGLMDCFGTAVSMSLQYGVPLDVYVNKFSHTRFEPMGFTKNPDIKIAKSIVDYIFRWLGITFLPGYREANKAVPATPRETLTGEPEEPEPERRPAATTAGGPTSGQGANNRSFTPLSGPRTSPGNGSPNGRGDPRRTAGANPTAATSQRMAPATILDPDLAQATRNEQFAAFQADAPSCDNCGSITVRRGNCYLCYNCGTSMGCS
jgi:ribonucleoside-diphosphate reductase alpha chain